MDLTLDRVSKRFGGVEAVSDLSMTVGTELITGLIGPNGAGKTTVINLISGTHALTSGRILFGDLDLTTSRPSRVARAGLARTFQNIRLLMEASVLENVIIGFHRMERVPWTASLLGLPASWRESSALRERAKRLLDAFGMADYADHSASSLAYGHQRRVEIMRALAANPQMLLLDEPVAGMTDVEAAELGTILKKFARDGLGILLVEHNVRFVSALCDWVHVLESGRLLASGLPADIVENPAVVAAYLGS